MKRRLRIVTIAATKGGAGKSTLSTALAVRASQESKHVGLIDADRGQNSVTRWHSLRGDPKNPKLCEADCSAEAIGLIARQGFDWLFIDTPTRGIDDIAQAISVSQFVLIPAKHSAFDVEAVDQVVELCRSLNTPFAFVINAAEPKWTLAREARAYLEVDGPVLKTMVTYRRAWMAAPTLGKTGAEIDESGKASPEIEALWAEVKAMALASTKVA